MTRELHKKDVCELVASDLQTEIKNHLHGDVLVIAAEDDRLTSLIPIKGQATLFGTQLDFGDAEFYTAPFHNSDRDQDEYLPHNNDERFHFEDNSFDTVVSLFSLCGYFQRGPPFLDVTRIVRDGGTILSLTGLQPESPDDHDAKWWIPDSEDVELEQLSILRYHEFKTPNIVSVFTVTSDTPRHPEAKIVTGQR